MRIGIWILGGGGGSDRRLGWIGLVVMGSRPREERGAGLEIFRYCYLFYFRPGAVLYHCVSRNGSVQTAAVRPCFEFLPVRIRSGCGNSKAAEGLSEFGGSLERV